MFLALENKYEGIAENIAVVAREKYFNGQTSLFYISDVNEKPTELVNSLAVLSGIADDDMASYICEKLVDNSLVSCTLSMKVFKYDAMRMVPKGIKIYARSGKTKRRRKISWNCGMEKYLTI